MYIYNVIEGRKFPHTIKKLKFKPMKQAQFRESFFEIEDIVPITKGITDGETWNGWALPFFDKATTLELLKGADSDFYSYRFDEVKDCVICMYEEGEDVEEYEMATTMYKGEKYYMPSDGWVWVECKSEEEAKIGETISNSLESTLSSIYEKNQIKSGDITPEQAMKWDFLVNEFANLFKELINQNK